MIINNCLLGPIDLGRKETWQANISRWAEGSLITSFFFSCPDPFTSTIFTSVSTPHEVRGRFGADDVAGYSLGVCSGYINAIPERVSENQWAVRSKGIKSERTM